MFTIWIRIDETLPWIEIKGEYQTRNEAKKAAEQAVRSIGMKIVSIPEKGKPMKALATIRTR